MSFKGKITDIGGSSVVEVEVPRAELELEFRKHWDEIKDRLHPDVVKAAKKGGYRELRMENVMRNVGRETLFEPVLSKVVSTFLKEDRREALLLNTFEVTDGIAVMYVRCTAHMVPTLSWKTEEVPGLVNKIKVRVPKMPADMVDRIVKENLEEMQSNGTKLVPSELPAIDGDVVKLSCKSTLVDGTVYGPGTFDNNHWLVSKSFSKIVEVYPALLGCVRDQKITLTTTLDKTFGDAADKQATLDLVIHQVFNRTTPEVDDELAKANNFSSLQAMKTALAARAVKLIEVQERNMILNQALTPILSKDVVEIGGIPADWAKIKGVDIYKQARSMVKSDQELFAQINRASQIPVTTQDEALSFLINEAATSLVRDLVVRQWGLKKEVPGDSDLEHISEYVDFVQTKMVNEAVEIEYYDPAIETPAQPAVPATV